MKEKFRKFATALSSNAGSPWAFIIAGSIILVWAVSGPFLHFNDTWQLVINTFTTLITFLMGFIIQYTQNRDNKAIQIKLDELIRATDADNRRISIDDLSDDQLADLQQQYKRISDRR